MPWPGPPPSASRIGPEPLETTTGRSIAPGTAPERSSGTATSRHPKPSGQSARGRAGLRRQQQSKDAQSRQKRPRRPPPAPLLHGGEHNEAAVRLKSPQGCDSQRVKARPARRMLFRAHRHTQSCNANWVLRTWNGDGLPWARSSTNPTVRRGWRTSLACPWQMNVVRQWPQMGEIVRTSRLVADVEGNFPELTLEVGRRHACSTMSIVVEWTCNYGDGRLYRNVTIGELEDGRGRARHRLLGRADRDTRVANTRADRSPPDMPGDRGIWPDTRAPRPLLAARDAAQRRRGSAELS